MILHKVFRSVVFFVSFVFFVIASDSSAQEKLTVSYSSVDAPSANWYIAQEKGF